MGKSGSLHIGWFPEPPSHPGQARKLRAFARTHRVLPRYLRGMRTHRHCCQWLQRSEVADGTCTAFQRGISYGEQQGPFTYWRGRLSPACGRQSLAVAGRIPDRDWWLCDWPDHQLFRICRFCGAKPDVLPRVAGINSPCTEISSSELNRSDGVPRVLYLPLLGSNLM